MSSLVQRPSYAPVGAEFDQGRPVGIPNHHLPGAHGERRREWWWQAGPMDTFCCCSLRTGILVVATLEVLYALLTICGIIFLKNVLPFKQEQYANECGGANAELTRCTDLARVNEDVAKLFATTIPLLMVLFHQVGTIVSAAIGVWAVLYANARAAKLYLWTQALMFASGFLPSGVRSHVDRHVVFMVLLITFLRVYQLKATWSYRVLLLRASSRNQDPSPLGGEAAGGMIELDDSSQVV